MKNAKEHSSGQMWGAWTTGMGVGAFGIAAISLYPKFLDKHFDKFFFGGIALIIAGATIMLVATPDKSDSQNK